MPEGEMNPAERAAEEILRGAYDEAQAESCPQGRECAVHFRTSEDFANEEYKYARMIDYVGDFVVITDDNPVPTNVPALVQAVLSGIPRWETSIYRVGDGTISDLSDRSGVRYRLTHDVWEEVRRIHQSIVSALEAGLIDVSKPLEG